MLTRTVVPAVGLAALLLGGCSGPVQEGPAPTPSSSLPTGAASGPTTGPTTGASEPTASPTAASSTPTPTPTPTSALPPVTDPVSLPALMRGRFDGGDLTRLRVRTETTDYTEWEVTYRSGRQTISGVLAVPTGRGPFPAVVAAHGYIDPAYYVTGQGLTRERGALATAGFVVLHTDYRGHAASSDTSGLDRESRLGYARDTINAARTLQGMPEVDGERIGLLGRSMGGGVVQDALVARPGLVDAAIIWSSVSSDFVDNLRQFTIPNRPEVARELEARYGELSSANPFYRGLSPRTYFDRITEPVLNIRGTRDDTCPPRWNRATHRLMRAAGVDSTLATYDDEHAFGPEFTAAMDRTIRFLNRRLA